jgi:hypothetical protein
MKYRDLSCRVVQIVNTDRNRGTMAAGRNVKCTIEGGICEQERENEHRDTVEHCEKMRMGK